jgi:hypothetical protein
VRAQSAHSGPARLFRWPSTAPPPFLFAPVTDRWGPAVRPFPYLRPSGQPRPLQGVGRYRPPPLRPSPSNTAIKPVMKLSLHSPSSIDGYPP